MLPVTLKYAYFMQEMIKFYVETHRKRLTDDLIIDSQLKNFNFIFYVKE